ncbi:hypothetical protein W97_08131 [Coniosporium apollinis CBS 100218]|uniref:MHYT domain-containing protein n=1 Tax=Coniosporium apollinis (strain CBS 100218) TaxID=1168221 RepID=R7Z444_CONA1|nr:uncharacterized protein W97_08131 [Coniosporium apollinis CBS 100218]EON68873.1 hypothetical protein W97_08131 [Coniosporium apollinis CBS 100218]
MPDPITTTFKVGDVVPFHMLPGLIIVSYIVSLVGSVTTVELLHRRKTGGGWLSWLQLAACSVSFGLVAIWCMHFVGNRAIILGDGCQEIQLYYNPSFTALSVFLPIIFLFFGFALAERFNRSKTAMYSSLVGSGTAAGLAITGMHYVGNFGTRNYSLANNTGYIVGAAAIAVVACWVALTVFFHWKEHWINSWWRRALCACVLAGAVSGMHWTATVGTTYTLKSYHTGNGQHRNTNLIIAISMCLVACLVMFVIIWFIQRRHKQLADRAQHVVLAAATFDPDGRLLVTNEGLLPTKEITRQFNQRSFDDEFNIAHPVFQWIYRVSNHWQSVTELIPAMRNHLRSIGSLKDSSLPGSHDSRSGFEDYSSDGDYSLIFREHFCVAAAELADHVHTPLQRMGILYDQIMMTGTLKAEFRGGMMRRTPKDSAAADMESGIKVPALFGRGQLLFVVRRVDRIEAGRLMSSGYRFASMEQVGDIMARAMQVPRAELAVTVNGLRTFTQRSEEASPAPGTYLACFALKPAVKTSNGNWDVLVLKDYPSQLPKVLLSDRPLQPWQLQVMNGLDGLTINQCIQRLSSVGSDSQVDIEKAFIRSVHQQTLALTQVIPEPFFRQAVFSATPVEIYSQGSNASTNRATLMAFCVIPDVHTASIRSTSSLVYLPWSFFKCQQRCHKASPDHGVLARKIYTEFGNVLAQQKENDSFSSSRRDSLANQPNPRMTRFWPFSSKTRSFGAGNNFKPDNISETELVETRSHHDGDGGHGFGGIMVSQDVTVDAGTKEDSRIELRDLGTKTEAGVAATEMPIFADKLFSITSARWQRP